MLSATTQESRDSMAARMAMVTASEATAVMEPMDMAGSLSAGSALLMV